MGKPTEFHLSSPSTNTVPLDVPRDRTSKTEPNIKQEGATGLSFKSIRMAPPCTALESENSKKHVKLGVGSRFGAKLMRC